MEVTASNTSNMPDMSNTPDASDTPEPEASPETQARMERAARVRTIARGLSIIGIIAVIGGGAVGLFLHGAISLYGIGGIALGLGLWAIGVALYGVGSIIDPESVSLKALLQIAAAAALAFGGWTVGNNTIRDFIEGPIESDGIVRSIEFHENTGDYGGGYYSLCVTLTGTNGDTGSLGAHTNLLSEPQCFSFAKDPSGTYPQGMDVHVRFYPRTTTLVSIGPVE